ncbi:juvenile hormone esterase-like [Halictus rubicundus]|uniref:juvenile hormone esterase-like n=1 Tax=Halictus rubicundus TaxID=77578 RepID=UPI0040350026
MKQFTFLFIVGLCVANILATCVVQTPLGLIKGRKLESRSGRRFEAFRGIPYAEPPVGGLRFSNPVPKKPWDHVLTADHDGSECLQLQDDDVHGSEDCLHLNVYTPQANPKTLYPVMLFLHGSGFVIRNDSIIFAGPEFILDKDVVLVVCNYRLGVLGFLSTGDAAAPGNFGIKDQALALKWVKDNIRHFGGDPEEITLFGQSTGADSVSLHALSSQTQNLFKRVIIQSGCPLSLRLVTEGPSYHEKGKKLAELLKCPTNDSHKMIDCLRKVKDTEITKLQFKVFNDIDVAAYRTWRPTKEPKLPGAIITESPEELIQQNKWKHGPLIIGTVKDEGTFFSERMLKVPKVYELCKKDPVSVIKQFLEYYTPLEGTNLTSIAIKAKNHYIGVQTPDSKEALIQRFTDLASDLFYEYTLRQFLEYLKKIEPNRSYVYQFDYHGTITATLSFPGELGKTGVGHGSDIYSEFPTSGADIGPQFAHLNRTRKDYEIVDIFIDLWTSFVNASVPISSKLKNPHLWQPQRNTTDHLKIGNGVSTTVSVETKYSSRVDWWFENIPQYCLD